MNITNYFGFLKSGLRRQLFAFCLCQILIIYKGEQNFGRCATSIGLAFVFLLSLFLFSGWVLFLAILCSLWDLSSPTRD